MNYKLIGENLKNDIEFALEAVKGNEENYKFIHPMNKNITKIGDLVTIESEKIRLEECLRNQIENLKSIEEYNEEMLIKHDIT